MIGAENLETFDEPGLPVRIGCDVHRWMRTYLGVFEHPFHTVSDASGTFSLDLPPGGYEVVAWHERYGEIVSRIEVEPDSEVTIDLAFDAEGNG